MTRLKHARPARRAGIARVLPGLVLLAGCAAEPNTLQTGVALRAWWPGPLEIGETARNFAFRLPDGTIKHLAAVRGRVTVITFPEDSNWPDCGQLEWLAKVTRETPMWMVPVVAITIGHPKAPCPEALDAALVCDIKTRRVIAICDPTDTVAGLFGKNARGHYFVLNNFLELAATGSLDDREALRADTRRAVKDVYDMDDREGMHSDERWGAAW